VARGPSPRCLRLALLALTALAASPGGAEELPAVARPRLGSGGDASGAGTVFFLALPGGAVAAVGAAHSFDLDQLAAAESVEFHLGRTGGAVARSERYLVPPGRPFADAKGSLREDVVVFALEGAPRGVRTLKPAEGARPGDRVRILGVPAFLPQDEDDIFGRVARVGDDRIDVDLDVLADLRGWGGAPVLSAKDGRVIGILEAAVPSTSGYRLGVAPIEVVVDAAAEPLEAGRGAAFAGFASAEPHAPSEERARPHWPRPSAEPRERAGDEEVLEAEREFEAGGPRDVGDLERADREIDRHLEEAVAAAAKLKSARRPTEIEIGIDFPADGAIFDSAAGAFLAGRALATQGDYTRFDVVLVLDTSGSTADATGVDVNGNGVVGAGGLRGLFRMGADPGDSILAAEVAAAVRLLDRFDPRNVRASIVTFSGAPPDAAGYGGGIVIPVGGGGPLPPAITQTPLTSDFAAVRRSLEHVLEWGPFGSTHMAAGMDQATIELLGLRGALSEPDPNTQKVVIFLTDGMPSLPTGIESYDVRACLRAADRARRAGITVHTFAIGPEALSGPIAPVEMAQRTGGTFTPVRNPADIVSMIEGVSLVDLSELRVRNLTTQKDAAEVDLRMDGGFGALVDLKPGKNRIEVAARADDGTESRREITLHFAPGAPPPQVPGPLAAARNALLERRLATLKQVGLGIEQQRTDQTRREIALEIERAQARAGEQRRELHIEPEGGARDVSAPPEAKP
jgi:hypothetical protein